MKHLNKIIVLVCLILVSSLVLAFNGGGAGTSASPYIITTCDQLQEANNSLTSYYVLGNDINCYQTISWNDNNGFKPIGGCGPSNQCMVADFRYTFRGVFDGKGFAITNLYIYTPEKSYVGLFGHLNGATVKNVGLIDQNITGNRYVGGLAGFINGGAVINFCFSKGNTIGIDFVGGLVGYNGSSILNSYSIGITKASNSHSYVGGLVGYSHYGTILNSYNSGEVRGIYSVGGLVGWNENPILSSYNNGFVFGEGSVGGLNGANNSSLTNSFNTGPVSSPTIWAYGLVGQTSIGVISNSYWDMYSSTKSTCSPDGNAGCVSTNDSLSSYYGSSGIPFTNLNFDTNFWVAQDNNYPILKEFLNCTGSIDGNAVLYGNDEYGVKGIDNNINILSNSNTNTTCEWHCGVGYTQGVGGDSNKCFPNFCSIPNIANAIYYLDDNTGIIPFDETLSMLADNNSRKCQMQCVEGYYKVFGEQRCALQEIPSCTRDMDSNAIPFEWDLDGVPASETQSILLNSDGNTSRKCEWYCRDGFEKGVDDDENKCLLIKGYYQCQGSTFNNAIPFSGDDVNLTIFDLNTKVLVNYGVDNNLNRKCEWHCVDSNYIVSNNDCIIRPSLVGVCGDANRVYYDGELFPGVYSRCAQGEEYYTNPTLGVFDGAINEWKCNALDGNVLCRATRRVPQVVDTNAITDLNVTYSNGKLHVVAKCLKNTFADLNLFNDKGESLSLTPLSIQCKANPLIVEVTPSVELGAGKIYSLSASIRNSSPDCLVCSQTEFFNVGKESFAAVADNSILTIFLVLITSIFLLKKVGKNGIN